MQGMTSNCEEVRAMLLALIPKMQESEELYSVRDIGYSLSGLRSMKKLVCKYDYNHCNDCSAMTHHLYDSMLFSLFASLMAIPLNLSQVAVHDEVRQIVEELQLKLSRTPFGGEPALTFINQDGTVRVKKGLRKRNQGGIFKSNS
jgi:hypothetical protein